MQNLLAFLIKYNAFFTFLILESIAIFLLVNYNAHQEKIFYNSTNSLSTWVSNKSSQVSNYNKLGKQNDSLALVISRMQEVQFNTKVVIPGDSSSHSNQFNILQANCINSSTNRQNNLITLNKGRLQGVQLHSGVIDEKGVVGIITNVSDNYSIAMSLLHRQTRISAAIKRSGVFGTVLWKGNSPQIVHLEDVPKDQIVSIGDTVITSGYSHIFPRDIVIGEVADIKSRPGRGFHIIEVKLINNFKRLYKAYIIENNFREEIIELESSGG